MTRSLASTSLACIALVALSAPAFAQADGPGLRAVLENVTGVEAWSFFPPEPEGGDPKYTLVSNRGRLGVAVDGRRLAFEGSFQYAQLLGLPRDAFGPGPLGPGALYFFSAQTPQAYQLYIRTASLAVKNLAPGLSLRAGRMSYASGEGTAFEGRLIGGAEWTPFERAFDGVRADLDAGTWTLHGAFVMPSQGAFEESASPTIGKVQLASAAWRRGRGELFAHNYRDTRAVRARPDNTGSVAGAVDVSIRTVGASWSGGAVRAWAAAQHGRWYGQRHTAFSASADVGHEWAARPGRPRLRGGMLYASGDPDPNDDAHGTFVPMVPTTRPDLLRGTFAQMNLRDVYAHAEAHPAARVRLGVAVHHLALLNRLDRWYSGTGATAFDGNYFGFSTRRSTLARGLGTLVALSASAQVSRPWRLGVAAGVMRGGDVVRRQFAGRTLRVFTLESVLRFD